MKTRTLHNALPIVAAAYGRKFGVKIEVGGKTAYTNGQIINIPDVSDSFLKHRDVIWGYLAHEAAHVRFTTFMDRPQNLYGDLLNILEDTRIEREMVRVYPGTFNTLYAVAEYMANVGHYVLLTPENPPAQIVAGYCLYYLQYRYMEQDVLRPFLDAGKVALQHILPPATISQLDAILDSVQNTKSTSEVSQLAEAIINLLKQTADSDPQKNQSAASPNQDQSNTDSDQEQNTGSDSNQGQGDEKSDQKDASQNQASDQNSAQNSDSSQDLTGQDSNQGGAGQSQASAQGDDSNSQGQGSGSSRKDQGVKPDPDYVTAIKAALEAQDGETLGDLKDRLKEEINASQKADSCDYEKALEAKGWGLPLLPQNLLNQVMFESNRLRTQLYGLVQAKNHTAKRSERRGKHLDKTRIARLVSGDFRVFSQAAQRVKPNTAVHLLIDLSSSMDDKPIKGKSSADIAKESALALALALESIHGVNVAVTYFCTYQRANFFPIVKHGEKVRQKAKLFNRQTCGRTPLAESLWYAGAQIVQTKNDRKIILVVTDGKPDNANHALDAIEICKRSGIELIGVGIRNPIVSHFFENHINITQTHELGPALFSLIEKKLVAAA